MDRYSRLVTILKVLLPLSALGLLSTLFLLSRSVTQTTIIPFAEQEIARRVAGQLVTAPHYSGVTDAGEEISIRARTAQPGQDGAPALADELHAELTTNDGVLVTLTSNTGEFDLKQDVAAFFGDVHIETSTGYQVNTEEMHTSLNEVAGNAPGFISGSGPIGSFEAGQMEVGPKTKGGTLHWHFKDGVKLVYDPKKAD